MIIESKFTDEQRFRLRLRGDVEFVIAYPDVVAHQSLPLSATLEEAILLGMSGVELDALDPLTLMTVMRIRHTVVECEPCPPTLRDVAQRVWQ